MYAYRYTYSVRNIEFRVKRSVLDDLFRAHTHPPLGIWERQMADKAAIRKAISNTDQGCPEISKLLPTPHSPVRYEAAIYKIEYG